MKTIKTLLILSVLFIATVGNAQNTTLMTEKESLSYALGVNLGHSFKTAQLDVIDADILAQAVKDVFAGTARFDNEAAENIIRGYFEALQAKASEGNAEAGRQFLAENKTKEGVVTLPSGLQYKMLVEGNGARPTAENTVKVHYHGTLIDGRVFDSSVERGEPIEFPLSGVIQGWTEGMQHVKEGGKIILYIPADMAYGNREMQGSIIEPGSTLIFEVELLEVK